MVGEWGSEKKKKKIEREGHVGIGSVVGKSYTGKEKLEEDNGLTEKKMMVYIMGGNYLQITCHSCLHKVKIVWKTIGVPITRA